MHSGTPWVNPIPSKTPPIRAAGPQSSSPPIGCPRNPNTRSRRVRETITNRQATFRRVERSSASKLFLPAYLVSGWVGLSTRKVQIQMAAVFVKENSTHSPVTLPYATHVDSLFVLSTSRTIFVPTRPVRLRCSRQLQINFGYSFNHLSHESRTGSRHNSRRRRMNESLRQRS